MIIPIRCFTCGKLLAHLWNKYQEQLQEKYGEINDKNEIEKLKNEGTFENQSLNELKIDRYCCRRMFLSNVDLCDKI